MSITTLRSLHRFAGLLGFLTILTFWGSTVIAELAFDQTAVAAVKQAIAYAVGPLCLVLACAGATGFRLAGPSGPISAAPLAKMKKNRTKLIAGAGLLVLVPCALYLNALASAGDFGKTFIVVQGLELLAGAMNIRLLWLNIRDGARLRSHASEAALSEA